MTRWTHRLLILLPAALILLGARPLQAEEAAPAQGAAEEEGATPAGEEAQGEQQAPPAQVVPDVDQGTGGTSLIYEAQVNLAVHEVRERLSQVIEIADGVNGYLQSQDDTSVIVRVPANRFRKALSLIEAVGDVLHRQVAAQDISDQSRDLEIRLENAVEMRDRLAALLERAGTVPDSLTIERDLDRLTQTIEQHRGQLRSIQDRMAYSTITVRFQPIRVDQEVPRERFRLPFPWLNELGLVNLLRL